MSTPAHTCRQTSFIDLLAITSWSKETGRDALKVGGIDLPFAKLSRSTSSSSSPSHQTFCHYHHHFNNKWQKYTLTHINTSTIFYTTTNVFLYFYTTATAIFLYGRLLFCSTLHYLWDIFAIFLLLKIENLFIFSINTFCSWPIFFYTFLNLLELKHKESTSSGRTYFPVQIFIIHSSSLS